MRCRPSSSPNRIRSRRLGADLVASLRTHTWATEALIADKPARLEAKGPAISQKQRTAIPWRFARAAPASLDASPAASCNKAAFDPPR
ncbi:protein of unassigned function [Methylobacterium oryzae CBMB20]|uniref:Protein of unassigned function n=1 Tax=Methylobacterium oryzae CBMB20 TaxID=693986 RepID=A0A089NRY0_9HYPH|nr:protein of unassigned function [Methylobacterium oryzae CBMB20]